MTHEALTLEVKQPLSFSFGSHEDALDFARHSAENSRRWTARDPLDWPKLYEHLEMHLILRVRVRTDNTEHHLIIFGVPGRWEAHFDGQPGVPECAHKRIPNCNADGDKDAVLGPISELVHCPNKWVPSFVRAERPKQRENIIRQVLAPTTPDDVGVDLGVSIRNREVSPFEASVSSCHCRGESGLVEDGSQALGDLDSLIEEPVWKALSQNDLMGLISGLRVYIDHGAVWLATEERLDSRFQIIDVFPSPSEPALGVTEGVSRE